MKILRGTLCHIAQAGESLPAINSVERKRRAFEAQDLDDYPYADIALDEAEVAAIIKAGETYRQILESDLAQLQREDCTLSRFGVDFAKATAREIDDYDWYTRVRDGMPMTAEERDMVAQDIRIYITATLIPTLQEVSA